MSDLRRMLQAQAGLQQALGLKPEAELSEVERIARIKEATLFMVEELVEALRECPGRKPWSKAEPEVREAFVDELHDVTHWLLNLWLLARPTADFDDLAAEIASGFYAKNAVNRGRIAVGYAG